MTNIHREVWNLITEDLAIQKAIKYDIINNRALAKYLIKKHSLKYTLDAVLSAVRRYTAEGESNELRKEIDESLKEITLRTKNNVAVIKLKDKAFTNVSNDFLTNQVLKENFRMLRGKVIMKMFVNQKDLEKKLAIFPKEDVIEVVKDLCEIRLIVAKDFTYMKGFFSRVTGELALHGVNLHDMIIAVPEIFIYVEEKDFVTVQKCLVDLKIR